MGRHKEATSVVGPSGSMPDELSRTTLEPALWQTVSASSVSIFLGKVLTHPLDTIKANVQVDKASSGTKPANSSPIALRQRLFPPGKTLANYYYRGFTIATLGALPAGALYMSSYEFLRPKVKSGMGLGDFTGDFTAGFLAEMVSCVFWCPVDVVKERMQVQDRVNALNTSKLYTYKSPADALRQIWGTEGLRGLYRAYGATLVAFGPQTAINLSLYEQVDTLLWSRQQQAADGHRVGFDYRQFLTATVSGCIATIATTPLDLAKLRMQVVRSRPSANQQIFNYSNIFDALVKIRAQEGTLALWNGAMLRCVVWVPQTAVFLGTYKNMLAWFQ